MKLLKVYRYVKAEPEDGGSPTYTRELFDALVIPDEGGMSSPLGPDEEFEVSVEDIE